MHNTKLARQLPIELQGHRYLELDSLRGLAAITVAVSHFVALWQQSEWYRWVNLSPFRIICAGHEAVVLFFVLSGFVLSGPYNAGNAPSYLEFVSKRFCRIYIPYFFAVLIAAGCAAVFFSTRETGNYLIDQTWTMQPSFKAVALLLLTSSSNTNQLDPALWTLILEIRMSLIFPFLYYVSRHISPTYLALIFILPSLVLLLMSADEQFRPSLLSFTVAGLFIVGILIQRNIETICAIVKRNGPRVQGLFFLASLFLFEAPSAVLSLQSSSPSIAYECIRDYFIAIGACGVIISALSIQGIALSLLRPSLVFIGSRSYSIYLVHNTILFLLIRCFFGRTPLYLVLPIYFIVVAGASEAFNKYVDRPSILMGRRTGKRLGELGTSLQVANNVFKPCYVFRPGTGIRRCFAKVLGVRRSGNGLSWVSFPWGARIRVNPSELVGREILKQGIFDISLSEVIFRLTDRGDNVVDVGANIGYMTGLMAARAGREGTVHSFEPHPDIFPVLCENAKFLRSTVLPYQLALGPTDGLRLLHELDEFSQNQGTATMSLRPEDAALSTRGIEVSLRTFDSLFPTQAIGVMKIDVEGFEMGVLVGAEQALRDGRIRHIVYEAWDEAASPVHAFLRDRGYDIFSIGYSFFGLALGDENGPCRINRKWETPNYLATLEPDQAKRRLYPKGWRCLRTTG